MNRISGVTFAGFGDKKLIKTAITSLKQKINTPNLLGIQLIMCITTTNNLDDSAINITDLISN